MERIFPIRVIRSKSFSLIYNPNYENITSNITLDKALAMLNDSTVVGNDVASSWVELLRIKPSVEALVFKLHHRPEYELYNLVNDPYELRNEINNPSYQDVADEMKNQLQAKLAELGDADPISTEKSLVNNK